MGVEQQNMVYGCLGARQSQCDRYFISLPQSDLERCRVCEIVAYRGIRLPQVPHVHLSSVVVEGDSDKGSTRAQIEYNHERQ